MYKNEECKFCWYRLFNRSITRYPSPKIINPDKTYFRIIKGGLHTIRGKVGDGKRLNKLRSQGIDVDFKGWYTGETKHILLCPSSPTVTYHINGISQQDWINQVSAELKKYTKREIRVRNKQELVINGGIKI